MKLINSIPKKIIYILDRPYEVYEPIRSNAKQIFACLESNKYQRMFRTLQVEKDPERYKKAFFLKMDRSIEDANRWVEKNYNGDRLRVAVESPHVNVVIHKGDKIRIDFYYNDITKEKIQRKIYCMGKADNISNERMKYEVKRMGAWRVKLNKEYNQALAEQRKKFREQVEKEIAERDGLPA